MDDLGARPLVAASAGSHIILPNYYCPPNIGIRFICYLYNDGINEVYRIC